MQDSNPGSLSNLNDIVVPDPVPLWPPAPGWIAVLIVLALALVWYAVRRVRAWQHAAYRREAAAELESARTRGAWGEAPAIVKRAALVAFPRPAVAPLSGDEWLAFLDRTGGTRDFTEGAGRHLPTLSHDPQASEVVPDDEAARMLDACVRWVRGHREEVEA